MLFTKLGGRACLAAMAGVSLLSLAAVASAQSYRNPIDPHGADPWVTQWKGQYFYTRTTGGDVRIMRSPYLQDVSSNRQIVWDPPTNTDYGHNLWAPELHRLNDKWYLYVAADDGADPNHRMYVLEGNSQDPQGSYTFKGQISIPENRWAIDGTILELGDKDYFVWSGRTQGATSDIGNAQSLYIAEMSNPWTLTGNRVRISSPTFSWERHGHPVNEGPQILKNGDDVFLTYSASGFYVPQYALGLLELTGDDPLDPNSWRKQSQPVFQQGNGIEGTGHASFVKSPDGTEDWIVYHARENPGDPRDLRIQQFTFGADGLPDFGEPIPSGQAMPAPSGVPLVTFIPNGSFDRGGPGNVWHFQGHGEFGVTSNNGADFSHIAGGDGPRVAYLGVGEDSGIHQDIGPLHAGRYTLSAALALGDDALAAAAEDPVSFLLRLESIGTDEVVLAELEIDSADLGADLFETFELSSFIPQDRVGTMLRIGVYAPDELAADGADWRVKIAHLNLEHTIPEPSAIGLFAGVGLLLRRRNR